MSRTPQDIQNELLVLQAQAGDRKAVRTLIVAWQPRLSALAWRLTREREAARDVVQDAWLAILRGLRKLDDPARFRTWAYRIVAHKCTDWLRRRVVQRQASERMQNAAGTAASFAVGESQDRAGEVDRLREALAALPDEQKTILALHYLDGMSVKEIGTTLGIPAGTVKSRLFAARNALREALERVES